ncbi:hypothetical protein M8818_004217 [Zalaria obscura]|uniref:Uncharacterized protein n=1 Tax=Zalaria obscura TaxID=2024903 RepID=A0ACC3SD56_9PEZI
MANSNASPIQTHLQRFLETRQPPKTFCPSEVARALSNEELQTEGAKEWREVMPTVREVVWEMRDRGEVEVLQKGEVLAADTTLDQVKGPIRVRKAV